MIARRPDHMPGRTWATSLSLAAIGAIARGDGGDSATRSSTCGPCAGAVLVTALTGAILVELIQGDDPGAYTWILGAGGVAYIGAWAWLRRRS